MEKKDEGDVGLEDESDDGDKISGDDGDKVEEVDVLDSALRSSSEEEVEVDVRSKGVVDLDSVSRSSSEEEVKMELGEEDLYQSSSSSGLGAGNKGRNKCSAPSNKKSSKTAVTSTTTLTPTDPHWPKDLPAEFTEYMSDCNSILREAMHQGGLGLCWAVALTRYIEALLRLERGVNVRLSPQHLVNSIKNKEKKTGRVMKYDEIKSFLIEEGLVEEKFCPYNGKIDQNCPKTCAKCDHPTYKISDLFDMKGKAVNEKEMIEILKDTPVLAVVEAYKTFKQYKGGVYQGPKSRKEESCGEHVVLVTGYGSTADGVHYWTIQNSWGTGWGENGFGKIRRQCSQDGYESSIFLGVTQLML